MFKAQHVVKREYFNAPVRYAILVFFVLTLLLTGFLAGYTLGVVDRDYSNDVVSIEEPAIKSSQYLTFTSPDRTHEEIEDQLKTDITWNPDKETLEKEIHCLAQNIYFEARTESIKGQVAVGLVTINRVLSEKYPNTICEVVWQKRKSPRTGRYVAQFSWTWDGKEDIPKNKRVWEETVHLAQAMLSEGSLFNFIDITEGATHYHADYVDPYWKKQFTHVTAIDTHIFYRDEDATPWNIIDEPKEPVALTEQERI